MEWKDVPIDDLLEKIKDKSKTEQNEILNDYITQRYEYLLTAPRKALPLLQKLFSVKESLAKQSNDDQENREIYLNDGVFLLLWMAKIHLSEMNDEDGCLELLDKAKALIVTYTGEYVKNERDDNLKTIRELTDKLNKRHQEIKMENETVMPEQFEEYLKLLKKKQVFQSIINENVGHNRHYGYLLTGNRGTGKRTAAKKLFEALKAIDPQVKSWMEVPAAQLFEPSNGFASINDTISENRNSLIYISDAEDLSMKGLLSQTGIEILATKLKTEPTVTVVLSGRRDELTQIVHSCQAANEFFIHRFHFDDFKPEALTDIAVKYAE